MEEEDIRNLIRTSNDFLGIYLSLSDGDEMCVDRIMQEIVELFKMLKIPFEEDDGTIVQWIIPSREQVKQIIDRYKRLQGDAM